MAADFQVVSQDTVPTVNPAGKLIYVKQIRFRLVGGPGDGHEDMVEVEDKPGYSEKALPLIEAKVAEVNALFQA